MAMPAGAGIKKWTTLATWSDADVFDYFTATRGQAPDHAIASLALLRSKFDRGGNRVSIDKRQARAGLDPAVIAKAQGMTGAPASHGEPLEPNRLAHFSPAVASAFDPSSASDESEETASDESDEGETLERAPAFKPELASAPKDAAGAALAAMVAPYMLDTLAPHIKGAVEQMHAHLAAHQATRLVIVREGERKALEGAHHAASGKVIQLVGAGANVMLIGPAGCGKTMLANSVAQAYERAAPTVVSCSAGMTEAQLLGRLLPIKDGGAFAYVESPFMKAYRNGGVILLDEMDAADANLLLVINAALANGSLEIEARAASEETTRVERHPDTIIMAAANTWGSGADTQYIGRGALDVSTLDRFYRVAIDYDEALERTIGAPDVVAFVQVLRRKAREAKLRRVVSTRMITRMGQAITCGLTLREAARDELASWTADERAKVGEPV